MKKTLHYFTLASIIAIPLLFSGCSSDKAKESASDNPLEGVSAEELYTEARTLFSKGKYTDSVEYFDEVERQHPYSDWAPRAQIMSGYAYYKAEKYDDAVLTLDRFVKLHPGHESAPYAYYMMAMSYYEQISDVGRDQGMTEAAEQSLRAVVQRFPNSDYARDAKLKLDLTHDHLAGKEMMVGRYYMGRDEYLSAINRFKQVVEKYDTTSQTPEALHRLVEAYLKLGIKQEAKKYAAVLGHNYPSSEWYGYSYELLKE